MFGSWESLSRLALGDAIGVTLLVLKGSDAPTLSRCCVIGRGGLLHSFYYDYVGKVLPLLDDDEFLAKAAPTPLAAGARKGRK